jgi:hypothetical protein
MKKGKIILGATAALVTIASSLGFKAFHGFTGQHAWGLTVPNRNSCLPCLSVFRTGAAAGINKCHTFPNGVMTLLGTRFIFFKEHMFQPGCSTAVNGTVVD